MNRRRGKRFADLFSFRVIFQSSLRSHTQNKSQKVQKAKYNEKKVYEHEIKVSLVIIIITVVLLI